MSDIFTVAPTVEGELAVLTCSGRLDADGARLLRESCMDHLEQGFDTLVLDLAGVPFVASSGLGTFLYVNELIGDRNGRLYLAGAVSSVREVLALMNIDRFLCLVDDVAQARAELVPA